MGPKVARYTAQCEGGRPESRLVFDIKIVWVVFSAVALLVGMFLSAATGVYATAHKIVPPIAQETVQPFIDKLALEHNQLRREMQHSDEQNLGAVRSDIVQLREDLRETRKVVADLQTALIRVKSGG